MIDQRLYWIWLTGIPSVGPVMQKKLLEYFHSPERIYQANKWELAKIPGMGPALIKKIRTSKSLEQAQRTFDQMNMKGIHLLTIKDTLYPAAVKQIPKAPIVLYYRGHMIENSLGVGIIGSRRCTEYGKQVTVQTADFLARHDIPVISGMAKGIDGYAHTACLKAGGYTLAFLGSGVDICYPKEHQSLMDGIIKKGAILSTYPPGTPIHPHQFYQRNFLISLWSSKLLVVEAGEKSGALSTANFAKEIKRDIWAVPNQIYCQESKGTNQLIAQGASIFLDPQQLILSSIERVAPKSPILEHPQRKSTDTPQCELNLINHSLSPMEKIIIDELKTSPKTMDQLVLLLNKNHSDLIECLSLLELEGMIRIKPNQMVELV